MDRITQQNTGVAPELAVPGVYNVANSAVTPTTSNRYTSKRINSLLWFWSDWLTKMHCSLSTL